MACEDTRHTRILLDRHGISARLTSFHDYNEEQRLTALLPLLREGKDVALVSDAGMPGLSDPGFSLVRACAAEGIPVTVLPGASSISTALVISGLPTDRFAFVGFLPRAKTKLVEQLAAFEGTGTALVAFESPRRIRASLEVIGARWPERRLAVCRELTKLHEEVIRGTAAEILERLADPVRGEIVLVLEPGGGSRGAASAGSAGNLAPAIVGDVEQRAREALVGVAAARRGHQEGCRDCRRTDRLAREAGIRAGVGGQDRWRGRHRLGAAEPAWPPRRPKAIC